ncbi:RNA polymerase II [Bulinus truncatus]|nr:RNA polymerase II [Bulinus truncatus]
MAATDEEVLAPGDIEIIKWKVKKGFMVFKGSVLALYVDAGTENKSQTKKLKANHSGIVSKILAVEGTVVQKNDVLLVIQPQTESACTHPTIMKDMCADCGADLRSENGSAGDRKESVSASVAMVHSIPELIVSQEQALEIGKEDENRLLRQRKLVLLVDLDQTLIHTTNDNIPPNLKGVKHFQLFHGKDYMWYHTRFRPFTQQFLESVSKMYELHICTFGVRMYAHTIARLLDPEEKYFSHRILSRDECFDALSKTANLKALFPCGDKMVSIIDDREDVWNFAPNLIHVKPYRFFQGTADINAPPGLSKSEHDSEPIVHKVVEHPPENGKSATGTLSVRDVSKNGGDQVSPTSETSVDKECCDTTSQSNDDKDIDVQMSDDEIHLATKTQDSSNESPVGEHVSSTNGSSESSQSNGHLNTSESAKPSCVEKMDVVGQEPEEIKGKSNEDVTKASAQNEKVDSTGDKCSIQEEKYDKDKLGKSAELSSSMQEEEIEWDDDDDYLLYLEEILTRIHKAYYDMYEQSRSQEEAELPDLKNIIPYVRKKVLKGANIVFSGMFPLNMPAEQSRAYIIAKALGANVQNEIVPKKVNNGSNGEATTHLVAAKPGTGKHKLALKTKGIHIVGSDWLWTCNERWIWVDERLFPLPVKDVNNAPSQQEDSVGLKKNAKKRKNLAEGEGLDLDTVKSDTAGTESLNGGSSKKQKMDDTEQQLEISMEPSTSSTEKEPASLFAIYNPLYSLSEEDIELIDKEVNEILNEDDDDSSEEDSEREARLRKEVLGQVKESDDSDSDSLSGDLPRGWKLHRKSCSPKKDEDLEGESQKTSDAEDDEETENELERYQKNIEAFVSEESSSDTSESEPSIGSVDDEIAEAVEKEFLGT